MAKQKKYLKRANSKNQLSTFSQQSKQEATVFPNFTLSKVIQMVESDPVARGALNHFVDKAMEADYAVINRKTRAYDKDFELTLDEKYNFRHEVIRKIFLMGKLFNNVYLEIIRADDGKTKAINVLDSQSIKPNTEPNGDPLNYTSRVPNQRTGKTAEWTKEDIVWIKFGDRTVGYAPVDMKALWTNLLTKEYVNRYVAWLWQTGQYRLIYNFKSAGKQDIEDWMAYNNRHDNSFKSPFITKGEMEVKVLRDMKEQNDITEYLKYLDNQTVILLRIPPVDVGIPESSGRSNADAQGNNLNTHIRSWQKAVEDSINFMLFPKINKGNSLLKFGPVDRFTEQMILKNIQVMKAAGMTNEACQEYLEDNGLFFGEKLFMDPVVEEAGAEGQPANPAEKDNFVSRQRKDGERESIGSGEQSSTREDQLRSV